MPIRSITRRVAASSPQSLLVTRPGVERVAATKDGEETVTYIPDEQAEPGPLALKLLSTLQGIQLGKLDDSFGWRFAVSEADGQKVAAAGKESSEVETVDQMD